MQKYECIRCVTRVLISDAPKVLSMVHLLGNRHADQMVRTTAEAGADVWIQ